MRMCDKIHRIRAFKDGDSWCMVFDDFVNLQESPSCFYEPDYRQAKMLDTWQWKENPAVHLPLIELARVAKVLSGEVMQRDRVESNLVDFPSQEGEGERG